MYGSAAAHVKWFTDPRPYPTDYSLLLTAPVIAAVAIALVAIAAAALVQRRLPEPHIFRSLERFAGLGPLVLGVHVGLALLVAAAVGWLFVPALVVERDALGVAILITEGACGLMLALGLGTRVAAVALALLGIVAMQPFSFESILEQVHILGAATFLFIVGRGAASLDQLVRQHRALRHELAPAAALALLRIAMGVGITFEALTEKLLDPALGAAFLAERPYVNVLAGLGVSNGQFVYLAGLAELVIGTMVVSGQLTRPVMAVGAVLFTITLPLFGWRELVGHLPYFGIMFTLFIAPNADTGRVRRQLREGIVAA
ncbi:MAG TPA: hypothetical protein VGQ86_03205 [Candidatus Limnocylindria bacterium]|nr:hypothetical protein [Candidatus Limnocylindria bacterium]